MFVMKLDENFFIKKRVNEEEEFWEYTTEIGEAEPLTETQIAEFLASYKEDGYLAIGNSDFYDLSILEIELIVTKEIKIKK